MLEWQCKQSTQLNVHMISNTPTLPPPFPSRYPHMELGWPLPCRPQRCCPLHSVGLLCHTQRQAQALLCRLPAGLRALRCVASLSALPSHVLWVALPARVEEHWQHCSAQRCIQHRGEWWGGKVQRGGWRRNGRGGDRCEMDGEDGECAGEACRRQ